MQNLVQVTGLSTSSKYLFRNQSKSVLIIFIIFVTGPPNGPILFCTLTSVGICRLSSCVVVCNAAGAGRVGTGTGAWTVGAPAARRVGGRATLHGRPVRLRPVRATPLWWQTDRRKDLP